MRDSLPILAYASPVHQGRFPEEVRRPLAFWVAAIVTALSEIIVAIFGPLHDWNSYVGPDLSLACDAIAVVMLFTIAAGAIIVLSEALLRMIPRLERRPSYLLWIVMGACFGLACTLPHTIDVALCDRSREVGGSLSVQGWGYEVMRVAYFCVPILMVLLSIRWRGSGGDSRGAA